MERANEGEEKTMLERSSAEFLGPELMSGREGELNVEIVSERQEKHEQELAQKFQELKNKVAEYSKWCQVAATEFGWPTQGPSKGVSRENDKSSELMGRVNSLTNTLRAVELAEGL